MMVVTMSERILPWRIGLLAGLLVVILATCVQACPTCKNALAENDPHHQSMVSGYYYSILFMMSMPFLLIGSIGGYFYLSVRRARTQNRQQETLSKADSACSTVQRSRPTV